MKMTVFIRLVESKMMGLVQSLKGRQAILVPGRCIAGSVRVADNRKKRWGKRNKIAVLEPKPSLLEKLVEFDEMRRRALEITARKCYTLSHDATVKLATLQVISVEIPQQTGIFLENLHFATFQLRMRKLKYLVR